MIWYEPRFFEKIETRFCLGNSYFFILFIFSYVFVSFIIGYLTIKIWPIDNRFDVRLFNSFNLSTVVLYFFAMEYKESPFWTVYVVYSEVSTGNFNTWPMDKRFDSRLFISFIWSIVVLYSFAMEYRESPFWTV